MLAALILDVHISEGAFAAAYAFVGAVLRFKLFVGKISIVVIAVVVFSTATRHIAA